MVKIKFKLKVWVEKKKPQKKLLKELLNLYQVSIKNKKVVNVFEKSVITEVY